MKIKKFLVPIIVIFILCILLSAFFLSNNLKGIIFKTPTEPSSIVSSQNLPDLSEDISMFPPPEKGMKRFVVKVPALRDEYSAKIQIIVGKDMLVDCNQQSLNGSLQEKPLEGWGYTYFEVSEIKGVISTLMGCSNSSKHEKFVVLSGEPMLYRYNSKLPIVLYVPEDLTVRYKIWSANETELNAQVR